MCDGSCNQGRDCDCLIDIYDYSQKMEGVMSFIANCLLVLMTALFLFGIFYLF